MPRNPAEELKIGRSRQEIIFLLSLDGCALLGVLLILASIIWKSELSNGTDRLLIFQLGQHVSDRIAADRNSSPVTSNQSLADEIKQLIVQSTHDETLGSDLLRDLGIALIISAFVTFTIERYASNRLRQHITYDVLSAAYAKVVPEKIYTQVADNIFRSNVYRRNWEVNVDAKREHLDTAGGTAMVTAKYSYDIENLNEHPISYDVYGSIDLDVPHPNPQIPRFISFGIYNEQNQELDDRFQNSNHKGPPENAVVSRTEANTQLIGFMDSLD